MEPKVLKLKEDFKQKVDRLNDYLWTKIPDPKTRIQQIGFFFFLKMLEEQDIILEREAKLTKREYRSIFSSKNEKYRWSNWIHSKSGEELLRFVRDELFLFISNLHNGYNSIRQIFHDARLSIIDPVYLRRTVDIIDGIDFLSLDADVKGDLYEELLNQLQVAGELGQFRTPRHIIRFIVEMVNPKIGETINDPACGTGGFLLLSYEYIRFKNSDPKLVEEYNGIKRGPGDKLSKKQWKFLQNSTFIGQDGDPEMVRISLMNLFLHGLANSDIRMRDTVAGSEDEEDLQRYDVIMTNPPFAGKIDKERIKKSLPIKSTKTQILFLGYCIDSLKLGGRCGIILPEGVLFGTQRDDKEIRRYLLENCNLQAVVSIPGGVFQPYAGVKTSVLIFTKGKSTKEVWFYNLQGDGSSLSKAHKFGPQYRNDISDLLKKWPNQEVSKQSWKVPIKEITENDYILSANAYNPNIEGEEKNHREPKEILREIGITQKDLIKTSEKIKEFLK